MGIHYFTNQQVEELSQNPFVDKVSHKAITYSEAFKHHFTNEWNAGKLPTQIFREAGFDTEVLGRSRIKGFSNRVKDMENRVEGFADLRTYNSGRPKTKDLTKEEEISYLKHQVALQKQQIEALKK